MQWLLRMVAAVKKSCSKFDWKQKAGSPVLKVPPSESFSRSHPRIAAQQIYAALKLLSPQRLAIAVTEEELILAALDFPREDRIHPLELHLHPSDFEYVALVKDQFVLIHKLGKR